MTGDAIVDSLFRFYLEPMARWAGSHRAKCVECGASKTGGATTVEDWAFIHASEHLK